MLGVPPPLPSEFGGSASLPSAASIDNPYMDIDSSSASRFPPGFVPAESDGKPPTWTGGAGKGDQGGKEEKNSVSLGSLMEELKKFTVNSST